MKKLNLFLVSLHLIFLFLAVSYAADNLKSEFSSRVHEGHLCAKGSSWFKAKNIYLEMSSVELKLSTSYDMKIYDNNDMTLRLKHSKLTSGDLPGEAILLAGRALLIKNINTKENYAIDIIDGTALFQQLVFTILELAADKGPGKIELPFNKYISESVYPIQATTKSASALFGAPWKSKIDLANVKDGNISYKIYFTYLHENGKEANFKMEGLLSNYGEKNINEIISDDFRISEWQQYNIGPYSKNMEKGTIYDFGTTRIEHPYATIGELRKYIREKYKE